MENVTKSNNFDRLGGQVAKLSKIVPKMGPKAAIWTVWATPYEDFGGEADSRTENGSPIEILSGQPR